MNIIIMFYFWINHLIHEESDESFKVGVVAGVGDKIRDTESSEQPLLNKRNFEI
jgi:hypothetical protein